MAAVKRAIVITAIVAAALGAVAIRVVLEGRDALAEGDAAMTRGRPADAIRHFESAARWYLPLAPHVDEAYARLRALAGPNGAKQANAGERGPTISLLSWRAIRSAARATRSLWTPHSKDLAAADAAIARVSAQDPTAGHIGPIELGRAGQPVGQEVSASEREAWHRARLSRDPRPSIGAAALAALGIVAWLAGAAALVRRGIDASGGWVPRPAVVAGGAIVLGLVCWALGLYNA